MSRDASYAGRTDRRKEVSGSLEEVRGEALRSKVTGGSPLRAYQDVVVGSRSWGKLVAHELFFSWGAVVPGAAGMLLRRLCWPSFFAACSRKVVWGRDVTVRHPANIRIGSGVIVDDRCYLDAKGCATGEFVLDDDVFLSRGCLISAKEGGVHLGPRATLGAGCVLYSFGGLEIGADTMVAAQCYIGGGRYDPHGSWDVPMHDQPLPGRGVRIGPDCWIGAGVVIVDGVSVGEGSVVGAGAVVTRDVSPFSIVAGVPARQVKPRSLSSPAAQERHVRSSQVELS